MACPLNNLNDKVMSSAVLVQSIQRMINNNVAIVFILIVLIGFLGVSLFYFGSSIFTTLKNYYINRSASKPDPSSTNSLKDKNADNEVYNEPSDPNDAEIDVVETKKDIDPSKFMPRYKKDFIQKLEMENKQYNEDKTTLMTRKLNYPVNDDVVDSKVLYKSYDNYTYDYYTE